MIVLIAGVLIPNYPEPMYRCRFQVDGGTFSVDHFTRDELIQDEKDLKARAAKSSQLPPEMLPGGGGDL